MTMSDYDDPEDKNNEYVRGLDNTTLLNNFFGFSVDTSANMSDSDDPEFK